MASYELTPTAKRDYLEFRERIFDDSGPLVAARMIRELDLKMRSLAEFPGMGRPRPDLTDEPVRFSVFYSWFVVYRPEMEPLQVVRLIHARRDVRWRL